MMLFNKSSHWNTLRHWFTLPATCSQRQGQSDSRRQPSRATLPCLCQLVVHLCFIPTLFTALMALIHYTNNLK